MDAHQVAVLESLESRFAKYSADPNGFNAIQLVKFDTVDLLERCCRNGHAKAQTEYYVTLDALYRRIEKFQLSALAS